MSNYLIDKNDESLDLTFKGSISIDELRTIIDIADRSFDSVRAEYVSDLTTLIFYNEKEDE